MRSVLLSISIVATLSVQACADPPNAPTGVEQHGITILERGPACAECSIELEEVAVLGRAEDTLPIGTGSSLLVTAQQDCVVAPTDRDSEVLLFDDCAGTPRVLGRSGEGPGELGFIRTIAPWRGDSVLFLGYGRLQVLSTESGTGRSLNFDPAVEGMEIATVPNDSLVIVQSGSPIRPQFMAIQSDGTVGVTFGVPGSQDPPRGDPAREVVLGQSAKAHAIWSGSAVLSYQLTQWSSAGQPLRIIERQPTWFAPYTEGAWRTYMAGSAATVRPLPRLRAVHETSDGLIWTVVAVAAADWQPDAVVPEVQLSPSGEQMSGPTSRIEHFDGVLAVLDAQTGAPLVSVRADDLWAGFANDTLVYARRMTEDGTPQIAVYRIRLRR